MNGKYINATYGGAQLFWRWFCFQSMKGIFLKVALSIGLIVYCLLCITDSYSAYVNKKESSSLEFHDQQLTELLQQVERLELDVKQRQEYLSKTYERVLHREGRLSEKHIIAATTSRLVDEPTIGSEVVSRSRVRYSPYQFDITLPSAVTAYELEQALANTGLAGLGLTFVKAELVHGVNAMFLTALAIHESHWGNSLLARDKHNLFGFGAYDADPYHYAVAFPSKSECIVKVAQSIREQYIDGQISRDRSIAAINYKYASDTGWGEKVFGLMMQLDEMIQQQSDNRSPSPATAQLLH